MWLSISLADAIMVFIQIRDSALCYKADESADESKK
jgi:hypothetical protein